MTRFTYVVLTRAKPGATDEFHDWYDHQHLADCVALPEVTSARRYRLLHGVGAQHEATEAPFDSLALYEIDSDDPLAVTRALSALAGSEAMPLSDALDRTATVKAIGVAAGVAGKPDSLT